MTGLAIRAVLFDMDGVLVHSFDAWAHVVSDVSVRFGHGPVSRERVAEIWGQGLTADAENLYPGRTVDEIRRAYEETLPLHIDALRVNPEAPSVLARLGRLGIRRGLVTNTTQALADAILERKALRASLDAVAGVVAGVREKPAPDLLLRVAGALRVLPAEALMVGDTRYDEEAARAAGMRFLRYDFAAGEALGPALAARVDGMNGSR